MHKIVYNSCYGGFHLSDKAKQWITDRDPEFFKKYSSWEIPRHNSLLVECVETLDLEASGRFSELSIVEIDGRLYRIDSYDGLETVITPDNIDWVIINPDE